MVGLSFFGEKTPPSPIGLQNRDIAAGLAAASAAGPRAQKRHSLERVELSKWIFKYGLYFILIFGYFLNLVTVASSCSKTRERKQLPSGRFQREGKKALSLSADCLASFLSA